MLITTKALSLQHWSLLEGIFPSIDKRSEMTVEKVLRGDSRNEPVRLHVLRLIM